MVRIALVMSGAVHFISEATEVDSVRTSELNILGKIGAESVFCMKIDDSPNGRPEREKSHKPDMKSVKADKIIIDIYQCRK